MRAAARAASSPANDPSPRATIESWSDRKKRGKRKRRKEEQKRKKVEEEKKGVAIAVNRGDPVDPRAEIVVVASHRKVEARVDGIRGEGGKAAAEVGGGGGGGGGEGRSPQSSNWRLAGAARSRRLWQVGSCCRISAREP
ncbi:hypothetical protein K0M31_008685 [Melipona bicolor]|uniref:Uncharacterized protein n=1 Tax=Melipona bicolor TaxID=60889 RepID=A0AA40FPL5_9HYME|nr:hypothetical protein K0M31_008685 [Melipona bicolor]